MFKKKTSVTELPDISKLEEPFVMHPHRFMDFLNFLTAIGLSYIMIKLAYLDYISNDLSIIPIFLVLLFVGASLIFLYISCTDQGKMIVTKDKISRSNGFGIYKEIAFLEVSSLELVRGSKNYCIRFYNLHNEFAMQIIDQYPSHEIHEIYEWLNSYIKREVRN